MEFEDTVENLECIPKLRECKTMEDIRNLVNTTFPTWISGIYKKYSTDYPFLSVSHSTFCKALKTTPKDIILVTFIPDEGLLGFSVLQKFLDTFTCNGFVVRRDTEFSPCPECNSLIPDKSLHIKMYFMKPDETPKKWASYCRDCM